MKPTSKKPSYITFLNDTANAAGKRSLFLRYTFNRVTKKFALGHQITEDQFDKNTGYVRMSTPSATYINLVIARAMERIEAILASLEQQQTEPAAELVAKLYLSQDQNFNQLSRDTQAADMAMRWLDNRGGIPEKKVLLKAHELAHTINKTAKIQHIKPYAEFQQQAVEELAKQPVEPVKANKPVKQKASAAHVKFDQYLNRYMAEDTSTKRTQEGRKAWVKQLREFAAETGTQLTFEAIDMIFYKAYGNWMMFTKQGVKAYNNHFGGQIKRLKGFLKWAELAGAPVNPAYKDKRFKILKEEKHVIYLSPTEIDLLWKYDFGKDREHLDKYRDLAVLGCLTSLRYSDLSKKLTVVDSVLRGKTKKTGGNYFIPLSLDPRIQLILKKYNFDMKVVSEQKFNARIKDILAEVFEKNGINQEKVRIVKYRWEQEVVSFHTKASLYSSHCNRRSFVTNMYRAGTSEAMILKFMGSKSNEELRKYLRIDEDLLLREADRLSKAA